LNLTTSPASRISVTRRTAQDDRRHCHPDVAEHSRWRRLARRPDVYSDFDSYSNELQLKSTGTHTIDWIVACTLFGSAMAFASTSTNTTATPAAHSIGPRLHSAGSIAGRPLRIRPGRMARDRSVSLTGGLRDSFDDERDIGGRNVTFNGCAPPSVSNCGPYTYGLSLAELQANNYAVSTMTPTPHRTN